MKRASKLLLTLLFAVPVTCDVEMWNRNFIDANPLAYDFGKFGERASDPDDPPPQPGGSQDPPSGS